jgi:hypothetical protein
MNTTDKMAEALPPLPPPHWPRYYQGSVPPGAYTADQMQAYARAALEAEAKPAPAEPEGWKLVPVEPTPEMIEAANEGDDAYTLRCFGPGVQRVMQGPEDHWLAMLAAAPAAPAPVPEADFGNIAKDAERYRWLRDKSEPPHNFYLSVPVEFHGVRYQPHEVDAYIDAAIAASKGGAA